MAVRARDPRASVTRADLLLNRAPVPILPAHVLPPRVKKLTSEPNAPPDAYAQNWADEDANHLPSIQGFFPGSPVRGGAFQGAGLSPPGGGHHHGFSPPGGGLGGFQHGFQPPPGMDPRFAQQGRHPPNYSFGTGVPNANDQGPPGGGYPGAPMPGFSNSSPHKSAGFQFGSGQSPDRSYPQSPGHGPSHSIGSPPSPNRGGANYNEVRTNRPAMPVPNAPPFTAFVGNFPYECPREEVVGLFTANACAIADVRMVRNRDTDRPRGYFLEFEDKPSLERALTFDQYNMGGRPLRVNVAEGRPDRGNKFGGGGGFADRYNERDGRRGGGGFADRYNDVGSPKGAVGPNGVGPNPGGSFGRREGGAGYQEARSDRGPRVSGGDKSAASFTGGGYHAPRGGGRERRSFDRDPSDAPPPEGRKKLELKPRSADADAVPADMVQSNPSKPNPFGSAKPVDTTAKIAEAERKIQEEKDRVNAKAGVVAKGEVPAPKPLSKSAVQPDAKRRPILLAPEQDAKIEATNVFALLNMDDEDGDDTDGDGEEDDKE